MPHAIYLAPVIHLQIWIFININISHYTFNYCTNANLGATCALYKALVQTSYQEDE